MKLFSWLFSRTPDELSPPPPPELPKGRALRVPQLDPTEILPSEDDLSDQYFPSDQGNITTISSSVDQGKIELEEIVCAIHYIDSEGDESVRQITMMSIKKGSRGPLLNAICHARHAVRTFRVDRIQEIITISDGECHKPANFFRDLLGIDISEMGPNYNVHALDVARQLRETLRPLLSVLVCAARSDEHIHPQEVDEIQNYGHLDI